MNWTALVESYLKQRHQLGYALISEGRCLLNFAAYAEQQKEPTSLTVSLALGWANLAPSGSSIAIARRFSLLRPFSRYLKSIKSETVLLPTKLVGTTHRRLPPYIFSEGDIIRLMDAANTLVPKEGLRPVTIRTLIGLLAATGLRPGEGVRLQRTAVNLKKGELTVFQSKGWHQRIIPLAGSTIEAIKEYEIIRDHHAPVAQSDAFFLLDHAHPLNIRAADHAFGVLRKQLRLSYKLNGRYPRLYDLRHTFVCRRVMAWYEMGEEVNHLMPQLSRYLGHQKVSDTYWYLTSIPALMACAANRFADFSNAGGVR